MPRSEIVRSQAEIDDQLNMAAECLETGRSKYPGMKFEEGVMAMYDWLVGNGADAPMED